MASTTMSPASARPLSGDDAPSILASRCPRSAARCSSPTRPPATIRTSHRSASTRSASRPVLHLLRTCESENEHVHDSLSVRFRTPVRAVGRSAPALGRPRRGGRRHRLRREPAIPSRPAAGGRSGAAGLSRRDRPLAGRPRVARRSSGDTREALSGPRGIHVREAVRLECPVDEVYRFWRGSRTCRASWTHLVARHRSRRRPLALGGERPGRRRASSGTPRSSTRSRTRSLAWRSLPGADVVTAGSVNFEPARGGRRHAGDGHLQYAAAGRPRSARWWRALFGREPSQTIREDLRRLKQLLEAGEIAKAAGAAGTSAGAGR